MILPLLFLGVLAVSPTANLKPETVNDTAFLAAIAQVESGGHATAIGQRGELGLLQFTRTTWKLHTREPFRHALIPARALAIGKLHVAWLRERLLENDTPATAYNLAAAWNAGATAVIDHHVPKSTQDYARRICNLMEAGK